MPFCVFLILSLVSGPDPDIVELQGHPLRLAWCDLNRDGIQDLVAWMVRTTSESDVEAFYADGTLWGAYSEQSKKETYLATFLKTPDGWQSDSMVEFGENPIIAFDIDRNHPGTLWVREHSGLNLWRWSDSGWQVEFLAETPLLQAPAPLSTPDLPMMVEQLGQSYWLVPDLEGIYLIGESDRFLPYPQHVVSTEGSLNHPYQALDVRLPQLIHVNGDRALDFAFSSNDHHEVLSLTDSEPLFSTREGQLFDLNHDRMADLVVVDEIDDVEGPKDLPNMKSRIRIYTATAPLTFPDEPDTDQVVPGIIFSTSSSPIKITDPFFDMNGDGLMDLAGIALKISFFQMAKVATIGRMKITFLMHLSVQQPDGQFVALAGGPYEMVWKLNLRRLRMPDFGQITADLNGDGWIDIFSVDQSTVKVVPVDASGIHLNRPFKIRIPKGLRDSDEYFRTDLNGDGKDEIALAKFTQSTTLLGIVEANP